MVTTKTQPLSVLICDDHKIICEALAETLRAEPGIEVACAYDKAGALEAIRAQRFDIVMMDIQMPGMNGLEGFAEAAAVAPESRMIVFSGTVDRDFVESAIERGAAGFIPKSMPLKALTGVIRLISTGQVFIPVHFQRSLPEVDGAKLTQREREVLSHLMTGKMNKQIAAAMNLTEMTVKMHVRSVCNKLGVRNRTQAAMVAERRFSGLQAQDTTS